MKHRFFVVLTIAVLLLAACRSAAGTPVTTAAPDVTETEPAAQGTGEVPQEEPAQTEEPAQKPTEKPSPAGTQAPVETETPLQATATAGPTLGTLSPVLGEAPLFQGVQAAILYGFPPNTNTAVTLENADGILQTLQRKSDPVGGVLVAALRLDGVAQSLAPGVYTYTVSSGDVERSISFTVTADAPAELPDPPAQTTCAHIPEDTRADRYVIVWCYGADVNGLITLREVDEQGATDDSQTLSAEHLVVFPIRLTLDGGLVSGTHVFSVLTQDGTELASFPLEVTP